MGPKHSFPSVSSRVLGGLSLVAFLHCAGAPGAPATAPSRVAPPAPAAAAAAPPPPLPPRKPVELVPVVQLPPPPPDQFMKVHGRNLLLKRGRVLSDVGKPAHRPQVPERWRREGAVHRGTYKVCVTTGGTVSAVSTLKTAGNRLLDKVFSAAIETWRYQPTRLGTRPVPFCYRLAIRVIYAPAGPRPHDPGTVHASRRGD